VCSAVAKNGAGKQLFVTKRNSEALFHIVDERSVLDIAAYTADLPCQLQELFIETARTVSRSRKAPENFLCLIS
jgi:CDP-diacylglycerol pyrophosphatase